MWSEALLNLLFPPHCEVCRKSSAEPLCHSCFQQIKFMKPQFGVFSASIYDGVLRTALHRLKFQKRKRLAEPLGILMVNYLSHISDFKPADIDYLVPVPLHKKRRKERGYNQAELLSDVIGRYLEIPVLNALNRTKNTHAQFDLPREKRITNIQLAFETERQANVLHKSVLLIDDIYTTGATANECCRTLMRAGARSVNIFTLARAVEFC